MKKEDFIEITNQHIESCEKILNGEEPRCSECPFCSINSPNRDNCVEKGYANRMNVCSKDETLKKNAKEFLEMCKKLNSKETQNEEAPEEKIDNINSPKHYKLPGLNIESIDIIRVILGKYFKWFCLGNIIKYILRAEKKNGLEDYKKARKYLDWLIEREEK